jgi:hypothetical protein
VRKFQPVRQEKRVYFVQLDIELLVEGSPSVPPACRSSIAFQFKEFQMVLPLDGELRQRLALPPMRCCLQV